VQNTSVGPQINRESNLDLQYAMNLVTAKQAVTLYQVGDPLMGACSIPQEFESLALILRYRRVIQ
jgi:tripeptidyl-peptidase-1